MQEQQSQYILMDQDISILHFNNGIQCNIDK